MSKISITRKRLRLAYLSLIAYRYKENIMVSLHYMVSSCKGRHESLVDNHIMGDVPKMANWGNNRQGHPPDQTGVAHPAQEHKEFEPKHSVMGHSSDESLSVCSAVVHSTSMVKEDVL